MDKQHLSQAVRYTLMTGAAVAAAGYALTVSAANADASFGAAA